MALVADHAVWRSSYRGLCPGVAELTLLMTETHCTGQQTTCGTTATTFLQGQFRVHRRAGVKVCQRANRKSEM